MIANENRSELLQSLKEGSFSAFEKLYNLYSGKLYNFMMRLSSGNQYMAEEVVQQTFIRLWEVREKVDPTENFVSYLCTIARNLSMNMYQHQTVEYIYTEYLLKSNPAWYLKIALFYLQNSSVVFSISASSDVQ